MELKWQNFNIGVQINTVIVQWRAQIKEVHHAAAEGVDSIILALINMNSQETARLLLSMVCSNVFNWLVGTDWRIIF